MACATGVITTRSLRINSDKKKLALWFGVFLAGFFVVGLAITTGISNKINEGFVSEFIGNEGQYEVETNLDPDGNGYYIVASVEGDTRRSRIISTVVDIQGADENRSIILEIGDSRTISCEGFGYCKEQILKEFTIEKGGIYKIHVGEFNAVDKVEILSLKLHSNHGIFLQAAFIFIGIILLILGAFMVVFSFVKIGYNKLLQRIKKSFAFLSR